MDDQKTKLQSIRLSLAGLSRRRKIAAVGLLLLLGAGISEPGFLNGEATVAEHGQPDSDPDLDEITALLDVFDEESNDTASDEQAAEVEAQEQSVQIAATAPETNFDSFLTIPPVTTETEVSPFQNVSQTDESSPAVAEETIVTESASSVVEEDHSQILVLPAGSRPPTRPTSRTTIRLTGTIYPVQ